MLNHIYIFFKFTAAWERASSELEFHPFSTNIILISASRECRIQLEAADLQFFPGKSVKKSMKTSDILESITLDGAVWKSHV